MMSICRLCRWLSVSLALAACAAEQKVDSVAAQRTDTQNVAAARQANAPQPSLDSLVSALRRTPGTFTKNADGSWTFAGSDESFKSFDSYRDSAVVKLVDCLADASPSAATVSGRAAAVGVMCYWTLRRLAYYEWHNDPEFKNGWPGEIQPTASSEQHAASTAWKKVVQQKRYSLT